MDTKIIYRTFIDEYQQLITPGFEHVSVNEINKFTEKWSGVLRHFLTIWNTPRAREDADTPLEHPIGVLAIVCQAVKKAQRIISN